MTRCPQAAGRLDRCQAICGKDEVAELVSLGIGTVGALQDVHGETPSGQFSRRDRVLRCMSGLVLRLESPLGRWSGAGSGRFVMPRNEKGPRMHASKARERGEVVVGT